MTHDEFEKQISDLESFNGPKTTNAYASAIVETLRAENAIDEWWRIRRMTEESEIQYELVNGPNPLIDYHRRLREAYDKLKAAEFENWKRFNT